MEAEKPVTSPMSSAPSMNTHLAPVADAPAVRRCPRMWFLLDSPNLWRGRALAGTPARTLALAEHCRNAGADVLLTLCDRGADYGTAADWPFPVTMLHPTDFYNPGALARHLEPPLQADDQCGVDAPGFVVSCEAESMVSVARPAAAMLGAHLVYDMHDDDAALATSLAEPRDSVIRRAATQRAALRTADTVLTLSRREQATVLASGVEASQVLLLPNGAAPNNLPHGPAVHSGLLVFVGNLFYEPNAQAVNAIRDRILPPLCASGLGPRVKVIGQGPTHLTHPARSGGQQGADHIEFTGRVDSVRDALRGAALALAPLTAGSGAKMKVLDYLAAGIPVLGTSEAVTGLGPDHPGVVVEDDLDAWPTQIGALLRDPARLLRLGAVGHASVLNDFAWPSVGARLVGHCLAQARMMSTRRTNADPDVIGLPRWMTEHAAQDALGAPSLTKPGRPHHISRDRSPRPRLGPPDQALFAARTLPRRPNVAAQRTEG